MENFFKDKKILITGHTGFKGGWLVQILLNFGAKVTGVALKPHTEPSLFEVLKLKDKINNYFLDIRNFEDLKDVFEKEKPEIVIHLAAQAILRRSYDEPLETVSSNTLGTAHVLECLKESGFVKSAVLITTDKVYENKEFVYPYREIDALGGKDLYSASKSAADIIIRAYTHSFFSPEKYGSTHNTLIGTARAGNVIGGGDWSGYRLIPDFIRAVYEEKKEMEIRSPDAIRPWQHVLDPISGYLLMAKRLYGGQINLSQAFNFGPEEESFITVENLVKRAINILEKGSYQTKKDNTKYESTLLKLDISKAKALLSWRPQLNLNQSLEMTFNWYKSFYGGGKDIEYFTNNQIKDFFGK